MLISVNRQEHKDAEEEDGFLLGLLVGQREGQFEKEDVDCGQNQ